MENLKIMESGIEVKIKDSVLTLKNLQKIKCLLGFHKEQWLGVELPFYRKILMKCKNCGKYGLWDTGTNYEYWVKDISKLPKIVEQHIIKNNL